MRLPAKTSEPKLLASRPVRAKPQKTPKMLSHCRRFKRRLGCVENPIGSPRWMPWRTCFEDICWRESIISYISIKAIEELGISHETFGQHLQWHRSLTCNQLLKQQPWEQSRPDGHRGVNNGKNGATSLNEINTSPLVFKLINEAYKFCIVLPCLFNCFFSPECRLCDCVAIFKPWKFHWGSAAKQLSCSQPNSNSALLCRRAQPMCMATRLSRKEHYQQIWCTNVKDPCKTCPNSMAPQLPHISIHSQHLYITSISHESCVVFPPVKKNRSLTRFIDFIECQGAMYSWHLESPSPAECSSHINNGWQAPLRTSSRDFCKWSNMKQLYQ